MPSPQIEMRLSKAREIARQAGAILDRYFGKPIEYEQKSAIDLVSKADKESDALIAAFLRAHFPNDVLCLEESDGPAGARRRQREIEAAEFAWCVDPLDGTTSFVHGYLGSAVSIGLLHFGKPALGVVFIPTRNEMFCGGLGVPATLNDRPIHVSKVQKLESALVGTGFPYETRKYIDGVLDDLRKVLLRVQDVRRAGAAATDLCDVAAGRLDVFYECSLQPWDTAAGQAIIEAAGGKLSGRNGEPHTAFSTDTIASNGLLHEEFLGLLGSSL